MTRTLKIETQIKDMMKLFVAAHGLKNIDVTDATGIRYFVLGATRFHYGQIKIFHPEHGVWIADYAKSGNLGTPKRLMQISTGAYVPYQEGK